MTLIGAYNLICDLEKGSHQSVEIISALERITADLTNNSCQSNFRELGDQCQLIIGNINSAQACELELPNDWLNHGLASVKVELLGLIMSNQTCLID